MGKEQHISLSSLWICLCLLFLCSYFFILKLYVPASYTTSSIRLRDDDSSPVASAATTSIEIAAQNDTDFEIEDNKTDPCGGRYIYVHNLPPKFNEDILKECKTMVPWINMCKYFKNKGFGPKLQNSQRVFSDSGWYETDQFTLEVIFKNRMEQYDCLTRDSSIAAAIYVPFYAGFDICRHLFNYTTQVRDALSNELVDWLRKTPEWKIMGGKDHFVVAGRVTWAFRRSTEKMSDWGDKFLLLPEIKNMSTLLIESSPFHSNDFAIPYPTYFHPSNDAQMLFWQDRVHKLKRNWLFSFAGATRPNDRLSIRSHIIDQCKHSKRRCKLLECVGEKRICNSPRRIIKGFEESVFCLQPPGDTYTRRSTFDSILAGCIPVFFHPASAYAQYTWHLPKNYSKFSVFISDDGIRNKSISIDKILRRISPEQIVEMRGEVIDLIPKIVYAAADSGTKSRTFKDAFDIAVEGLIHRVKKLRKDIVKGTISENLHEDEDVDYGQIVLERPHEWDPFFKYV